MLIVLLFNASLSLTEHITDSDVKEASGTLNLDPHDHLCESNAWSNHKQPADY